MILTTEDIRIIFEALEAKYGRWYLGIPEVGRLQAKLSIMMEMAAKQSAESSAR